VSAFVKELERSVDAGEKVRVCLLVAERLAASERMDETRASHRLLKTESWPGVFDVDGMTTMHSSLFVALELFPVSDATVVDETLCARKVFPVTVVANEFDGLSIGSF
jgi:hypothetical protein